VEVVALDVDQQAAPAELEVHVRLERVRRSSTKNVRLAPLPITATS
jgi:hypothetical protein